MLVELEPISAAAGDDLIVRVPDATVAGATAVVLSRVSDLETAWLAEVGMTAAGDGGFEGRLALGISEECVAFATHVRTRDGSTVGAESNGVAINSSETVSSPDDVEALRARIEHQQATRYSTPLGDSHGPNTIEHRVLCVIERLLVTRHLRLPGVQILPVTRRPDGSDQYSLLDDIIRAIGWSAPSGPAIALADWRRIVEANRPWTSIVCNQVFAEDFNSAAALAWEQRDRLIAVLGLSRGARGRPVATFVQQRQPDDTIKYRCFVEDQRYTGNLVGGFISGEDQRGLLVNVAGMQSDPLVSLLVDLFAEALADHSADARYLRFWSILETLSGARIPDGQPVALLDGSRFPGGGTTSQAAPRVYQLLADRIVSSGINEASVVAPAANLYEAVRAWYARRNATGHYGRLDPTDPRQSGQNWMRWARLTIVPAASVDGWLGALQRLVEFELRGELARVGGPLI
jgi:hypothetical protein